MESLARRTPGEHAVNMWIEKVHQSIYQGAAHSMAAVGMIAPLVESVFGHTISRDRTFNNRTAATDYALQAARRETENLGLPLGAE